MNGDAVRATTEIRTTATRVAGLARVARPPSTNRWRSDAGAVDRVTRGRWTRQRAIITAKNDAALIPKAHEYPPTIIAKPARAGPITRPMLYCAEPSEIAAPSSLAGTRSGSMA